MDLLKTNVSIPIGADHLGAYFTRPAQTKGSIILMQEIFGVTPAMRAIADDLASAGYAVVVPDIYWRLARDLDLGNGEDAAERQAAVDYSVRYDEVTGVADLAVTADWLQAKLAVQQRPVVFGFCLGGRMAVRLAAATPLSGMISMYGVGLNKLGDLIQTIQCPVQFHFGTNDNHNPVEVIQAIRDEVAKRARAEDEFHTYDGAEHAFFNQLRADRFNHGAHELARSRALRFAASCFAEAVPTDSKE